MDAPASDPPRSQHPLRRASMRDVDRFEGLAGTCEFEPDGELAPGTARVHLSRDEGSRWIRLAGP